MKTHRFMVLLFVVALVAAACGGEDGNTSSESATTQAPSSDASAGDRPATNQPAADGSSLTFDGETIALNSRGCYGETQEVAGYTFTLTAQASGTNAGGDAVVVDYSQTADGPSGAGDDVTVSVGGVEYHAFLPEGTVAANGSVSASDVTLSSFSDGSEATVSFSLAC